MSSRGSRYPGYYPEYLGPDGQPDPPLRDEFGMKLPFYIRDDLVSKGEAYAYDKGRADAENDLWERWGFEKGAREPRKRGRRVMG